MEQSQLIRIAEAILVCILTVLQILSTATLKLQSDTITNTVNELSTISSGGDEACQQ